MTDTRLTFFGATGEVTGSCTLVETRRARVLIDFGMIQGAAEVENRNTVLPPLDVDHLDAVVITHAHMDHCGRLPMLAPLGLRAPIFATQPTTELLAPILHGSARLQSMLAWQHANPRPRRASSRSRIGAGVRRLSTPQPTAPESEDAAPPRLYTEVEVAAVLPLITPLPYLSPHAIAPGITLRFLDAGHVIGSASIELTIGEGIEQHTIVFSGDLGPNGAPLVRPVRPPDRADVLVLESTYGDRVHPEVRGTLAALAEVVREAKHSRSRVLAPTFTLGRAQQLLFRLGQLSRDGRLMGVPVYLDSKMALIASETYMRHPDLLDAETARRARTGDAPLQFPELIYIDSREDSRRLNHMRGPGIIIAGSGFCHGGPIVHHLRHGLHRHDCRVLLIGHQPHGTPAGDLARGARSVFLDDEEFDVEAKVHRLPGFSGHADRNDLRAFAAGIPTTPGIIILNHGETDQRAPLATAIANQLSTKVLTPHGIEQIAL